MRVADEERGVLTQAWRPLGRGGELLAAPPIADAAARHGRTPAQVVLRWHVQLGAVPIPKSATPERMASNLRRLRLRAVAGPKWTRSPGSPGAAWPATPTRTRSSERAVLSGAQRSRRSAADGTHRPAKLPTVMRTYVRPSMTARRLNGADESRANVEVFEPIRLPDASKR